MTIKEFLDKMGYTFLEDGDFQGFFDSAEKVELLEHPNNEDNNWKAFSSAFLSSFDLNEVLSKMHSLNWFFGRLIRYAPFESIEIPDSIEEINDFTFSRCKKLKSIKLPKNLKHIYGNVFWECYSLESIEIPDSVESIDEYAFSDCTSLKSVKLPKNLKRINEGTFNNCHSLESIEIPDSVEEIGKSAFEECTNLESIKLPKNLKEVDEDAFKHCFCLETVEIDSSNPYFTLDKDGNLVSKADPNNAIITMW